MSEATSYLGSVISRYTEQEAVEDGILMSNLSRVFPECTMLTTNLWEAINEKGNGLSDTMAYLNAIMLEAAKVYYNKRFKGDHDKYFFIIADFAWPIWFVRNENDKLTAMLAEDY
tara:strand:+ start:1933 stop:2277 length:345 start_codon:yes stop_codon:yes gene_type:complete